MGHPAVPRGPEWVFLDLGSGKGKALLMASRYGFQRVIGVELSPDLAAVGRRNVERYRQRHPGSAPIEVICADATEYPIPRDPLLLYLHNPFDGQILAAIASRLVDSVTSWPRDVSLLYHSPIHRSALEGFDSIEPIVDVHGGILYSVRGDARGQFG
jgi:SAM-dependent methyltransferase